MQRVFILGSLWFLLKIILPWISKSSSMGESISGKGLWGSRQEGTQRGRPLASPRPSSSTRRSPVPPSQICSRQGWCLPGAWHSPSRLGEGILWYLRLFRNWLKLTSNKERDEKGEVGQVVDQSHDQALLDHLVFFFLRHTGKKLVRVLSPTNFDWRVTIYVGVI